MKSELFHRLKSVPPIVNIIITQAARHRAHGAISPSVFDQQMQRLELEELSPKDLSLLVRKLSDGRTRVLIKERRTGTTCDLLEFSADGTPVTALTEVPEHLSLQS